MHIFYVLVYQMLSLRGDDDDDDDYRKQAAHKFIWEPVIYQPFLFLPQCDTGLLAISSALFHLLFHCWPAIQALDDKEPCLHAETFH